jgi:hypothetical protein
VHFLQKTIFPLYAIGLILVLSLSTAHKGIHDLVFHWDAHVVEAQGVTSSCSGNDQQACSHEAPEDSEEGGCDSLLCPVSIFSEGFDRFEIVQKVQSISISLEAYYSLNIVAIYSKKPNKSNFVRGPPSFLKV